MPNLNPRTDGKEYPAILIHGPSGSGKTRAAATASAFHALRPKAARTEMVNLTDMLWLLFDKDGLQSVQSQGMDPHYYDFSYMVPDLPSWLNAVNGHLDDAKAHVGKLGIQYVIVDTLSSICDYFDTYFLGSSTVKDPRLAYNASLQCFRNLLLKLRALPCNQIWLCHSRSAFVDPGQISAQQKAVREATLPGECRVDLALTNGWRQVVRPLTNLTMGLDVEDSGSKATRFFITQPGGDYYVKNRYDDLLLPKEPVDLRSIFGRITAFENNLKGIAS